MASPWIKAVRLRTLPLAAASLTMGAILAGIDGSFDWSVYLLSLATAFSLQILSNLANDYGDAVSGIDGEDRAGPTRTVQDGLISKVRMKRAIGLMVLMSLTFGIGLVLHALGGRPDLIFGFILIGLFSIVAAIKYTMGARPYGYRGYGDAYVLVFFGWIGVAGSYVLYTHTFTPDILLPASTLGLMAVAVLNINNIRDIESDKRSGKFSIPVRIGRNKALVYHGMLHLGAIIFTVCFAVLRDFSVYQWAFVLVIPLLIMNFRGVSRHKGADKIDPYLKQMALITLLFVFLFFIGNLNFG